jgi:hypothetical protein
MSDADFDLKIDLPTIQRWKARFPLHYSPILMTAFDWCNWQLGRRDLAFVLEANRRATPP